MNTQLFHRYDHQRLEVDQHERKLVTYDITYHRWKERRLKERTMSNGNSVENTVSAISAGLGESLPEDRITWSEKKF